jgi:hypothetical protein
LLISVAQFGTGIPTSLEQAFPSASLSQKNRRSESIFPKRCHLMLGIADGVAKLYSLPDKQVAFAYSLRPASHWQSLPAQPIEEEGSCLCCALCSALKKAVRHKKEMSHQCFAA